MRNVHSISNVNNHLAILKQIIPLFRAFLLPKMELFHSQKYTKNFELTNDYKNLDQHCWSQDLKKIIFPDLNKSKIDTNWKKDQLHKIMSLIMYHNREMIRSCLSKYGVVCRYTYLYFATLSCIYHILCTLTFHTSTTM